MSKVVSFRLDERLIDALKADSDKVGTTVAEKIERALQYEKAMQLDIKGVFSKAEWQGLAASCNGTMITDTFRFSANALIAHCEDAELYEQSFSNFGADVKCVCNKAAKLTRLQVCAVYDRIEAFWNNQNGTGIELEKWAEF